MLFAPESHSLKAKRAILRRIKDRTAHRFKVSVAEVDLQDQWNKAVVGFAVVSSSAAVAEGLLESITGFVSGLGDAHVIADDREVVRFDDVDFGYAEKLMEKYR